MIDAFAAHGIDHLSASSLNTYVAEPALWVMERLLKRSAPPGCAAHRGGGIEDGVTIGLLYPDKPVDQCQELALQSYERRSAFAMDDPRRAQERDAVAPTVSIALRELRRYGIPNQVQKRVDQVLSDDLPPLVGYLDYGWSQHGIVIDLKTELRLSSDAKKGHARQVAGYVQGTNWQGRLAYATPKRIGVYPVEDAGRCFGDLREIARRLGRFLALSKDPMELAGLLVPDTDHWMWSSKLARDNRIEVYGL